MQQHTCLTLIESKSFNKYKDFNIIKNLKKPFWTKVKIFLFFKDVKIFETAEGQIQYHFQTKLNEGFICVVYKKWDYKFNIFKKFNVYKSEYKYFNLTHKLWEEKILLFHFIPVYIYSIRKGAKLKKFYKLFKYRNSKYIKKPVNTQINITLEEGIKQFGSKWSIPTNYNIITN